MLQIQISHPQRDLLSLEAPFGVYMIGADASNRIVLDDGVDKLKENADVKEFYLGLTEVGKKKSYRDVKHYKRRKRWLT